MSHYFPKVLPTSEMTSVAELHDSAIFEISRRITEAQLRAKLRTEAPNL